MYKQSKIKNVLCHLSIVLVCFNTLLTCGTEKNVGSADQKLKVNFYTAMTQGDYYDAVRDAGNPFLASMADRYEQYVHALENATQVRIPKIIHQIWLGSPLPEKYKNLQETWLRHNPDWQYYLWTDTEIAAFGLTNQALYDATSNYGEKTDIARYEILYRIGGLYCDTDVECLCSFDVLHTTCDFYAGIEPWKNDKINDFCIGNAIIGSKPGHPVLGRCIETMRSNTGNKNVFWDIIERTGPLHLTACVKQEIATCDDKTVIFPSTYFYPWKRKVKDVTHELITTLKPESFAIHYWDGSWVPVSPKAKIKPKKKKR